MSYQLELRHFKYFVSVAEELNFKKASERLFISQPGLSRQIKQMEEILGSQLFERTKRNVQLTASGRYLLAESKTVFSQLKRIERQIALIDKGEAGELRIGFLGSAMQEIVPQFLLKLNSEFPAISTTLDEMNNQAQIEAVKNGGLDIGFVRVASVPKPLKLRAVIEDTFSLVLPVAHQLNRKNFVNIEQLKNENFILFSSDYSPLYYDKIMSIFRDQGYIPKISHKSVHALTIFKLVESGLGIAIIPTSLSQGFSLDVKFIELNMIPQRTILSAIWNEENRNPIIQNATALIFHSASRS